MRDIFGWHEGQTLLLPGLASDVHGGERQSTALAGLDSRWVQARLLWPPASIPAPQAPAPPPPTTATLCHCMPEHHGPDGHQCDTRRTRQQHQQQQQLGRSDHHSVCLEDGAAQLVKPPQQSMPTQVRRRAAWVHTAAARCSPWLDGGCSWLLAGWSAAMPALGWPPPPAASSARNSPTASDDGLSFPALLVRPPLPWPAGT